MRLVSHWLLVEGVATQMEAVREGFESVFPMATLQVVYPMLNYLTFIVAICRRISLNNLTCLPTTFQMFYPDELDQIFCGSSRQSYARWEVTNLNEACKPDHGYNTESRSVTFELLWCFLSISISS